MIFVSCFSERACRAAFSRAQLMNTISRTTVAACAVRENFFNHGVQQRENTQQTLYKYTSIQHICLFVFLLYARDIQPRVPRINKVTNKKTHSLYTRAGACLSQMKIDYFFPCARALIAKWEKCVKFVKTRRAPCAFRAR